MSIRLQSHSRLILPKDNKRMSNRDKELMEHYEPEVGTASESAWQKVLDKYGVSSFFKVDGERVIIEKKKGKG